MSLKIVSATTSLQRRGTTQVFTYKYLTMHTTVFAQSYSNVSHLDSFGLISNIDLVFLSSHFLVVFFPVSCNPNLSVSRFNAPVPFQKFVLVKKELVNMVGFVFQILEVS